MRLRIVASLQDLATGEAAGYAMRELLRLHRILDAPSPDVTALTGTTRADRLTLVGYEADQALLWFDQVAGRLLALTGGFVATGSDPIYAAERLLASEGTRASVWASGGAALGVAMSQAAWGTANGARGIVYRTAAQRTSIVYRKQAIAAIDRRTTSCCLRVHGQIVDLDDPFTLSGTPRYADQMQNPPFHSRCRTSIVLYHASMEAVGTSTETLRTAARAEAARR
jgi:hypothetical protein